LVVVPESSWNTYRVRPWLSSRIFPGLVLSTPRVAALPLEVFGGVEAGALLPPPPRLARAGAVRGSPRRLPAA
jgi:hypothetical protein